ncbi:hypothetical protein D9M68_864330 [compost metagenome]
MGSRVSPSGVRATLRVVRTSNWPPRDSSRFLIARLRAGWDRCSRSQAWAKLRLCATARKARSCLTVIILLSLLIVRKNKLNKSVCSGEALAHSPAALRRDQ